MSLADLFTKVHEIPSIPEVVQELIVNFNNPDIDADQIASNIQRDQMISAKVMRLANSARFGGGRSINSIDSAVVMLGFDTLKTLIVASGVTSSIKEIPGFDLREFWSDSFTVASLSKAIAQQCGVDAEAAFTCGLLHNIGEALIHIGESEVEREIDRLVQCGKNRVELQNNKFGFDYTGVGRELANRWKFPEEILDGIRQHATPSSFETFSDLAAIIYLARMIKNQIASDMSAEDIQADLPENILQALKLDGEAAVNAAIEVIKAEDDMDQVLAA